MKDLLTVSEVAKKLKCSEATVKVYCATGQLPGAYQPGGSRSMWLIPADALKSAPATPNKRGRKFKEPK
jgi:hypothetical protein